MQSDTMTANFFAVQLFIFCILRQKKKKSKKQKPKKKHLYKIRWNLMTKAIKVQDRSLGAI